MYRTATIQTFGCKVNQHESTLLEDRLLAAGWALVPVREPADLVVINSCTVTQRADADARKAIRQALRRNPEAFVVLTGCYAQVAPEAAARQEGIDLILGNQEKYALTDFLPPELAKTERPRVIVGDIQQATGLSLPAAPQSGSRARAFLKVQEGCHLRCAFCIVPLARGNERSVPLAEVLAAVESYHAQGYREVVLTGVHLGGYGRDQGTSLAALIRALTAQGLGRVRVSSLEPMEVDGELLEAFLHPAVCPHFHLPAQSGSDAVLRRMGRPYTAARYREICDALREQKADVCIGTDLIVGFPGETEEDFAATAALLADGPLDYAHLFPYSIRSGTRAARMVDQVPSTVKSWRMAVMQAIDARKREAFARQQDGAMRECILEWPADGSMPEMVHAMADNYATCEVETAALPVGRPSWVPLQMAWDGARLIGQV